MRTTRGAGGLRLPTPDTRLPVALLAAALLLAAGAGRAGAEAALAVGLSEDVAKQGLAVGWAINHRNRKSAEAEALRRCRASKEAPQATRDLCRIVERFDDACLAVAADPDAGTAGIGWAVTKDADTAEEEAMADCVQGSKEKRRKSCRIVLARCDGR